MTNALPSWNGFAAERSLSVQVLRPRDLEEALAFRRERRVPPARGRHGRDGRAQLRPPPSRGDPRSRRGLRARRPGARATTRSASAPASRTRGCSASSPRRSRARARGAHGRLAPDPQPRHDRRQPRRGLAGGRLPPPAARARRRDRAALARGDAARARARVLHRPEAQRAAPRRADHRRARAGRARAAAVREGRHPQRDGDRRLLVRARARPRGAARRHRASARPAPRRCAPARPRTTSAASSTRPPPGTAGAASPTSAIARFGELVAAAAPPIDDVRGSAAYRRHALGVLAHAHAALVARRAGGHACCLARPSTARPARSTASGRARACSTCCASGSACPARRTPASRASAARARSTSTARSSAAASCSPRRPRGARS